MKQPLQLPNRFLLACIILAAALPLNATAQVEKDADKTITSKKKSIVISRSGDGSGDGDESVRIEMQDGKTWVNGVEVPEGEDVKDYLPDGFDIEVLDRSEGGRFRVFSKGDDPEARFFGRLRSRDADDDVAVWFDDDGARHEERIVVGRPGTRDVRITTKPGEPRRFRMDEDLSRFGEDLVELGGAWGGRAASFFSDLGSSPTSPEIVKMDVESRRLANEMLNAEGKEREELSRQLDELLESIFDKKTALREQQIEKLTEKLREEQETVAHRKKSKQQMIRDRKADLTGSKKSEW